MGFYNKKLFFYKNIIYYANNFPQNKLDNKLRVCVYTLPFKHL